MKKKLTVLMLCSVLLGFCLSAEAQQPAKIPRIGYLSGGMSRSQSLRHKKALRELGYVEGRNIFIEWRSAEGEYARLPALAAELVRLKVDIIVTLGASATRPAKEATSTIPIVMSNDNDPVGNGFVTSLARPGGNITGLATLQPELGGKRLELLKEIIPKLSRLTVIGTSTQPAYAQRLKEIEIVANAFEVKLQYQDVLNPNNIDTAFRAATKGRAEAILLMGSGVINSQRNRIVELAIKSRLPVMYGEQQDVEAGGLMSYGVNQTDMDRRAAAFVDKILKGAKPADLPVEQPKKFEFIVNLKAAKQIGLTIPPNVLVRADRVIK